MEQIALESTAAAFPLWVGTLVSYLLGATPFGFLFARMKGVDLRRVGSGNIGATNTIRAIGKGWGLTAFFLDFAKGWVPVVLLTPLVATDFEPSLVPVLLGAAAVVGHCFPVYLGFRGGKGVATACGAIVGRDPFVFLGAGAVWLLVMLTARFVGLASILMGITFPILAWTRHPADRPFWLGASLLTVLILLRHRTNLVRMLAGTEPRSRPLFGLGRGSSRDGAGGAVATAEVPEVPEVSDG